MCGGGRVVMFLFDVVEQGRIGAVQWKSELYRCFSVVSIL
jgi:hypothetical protein